MSNALEEYADIDDSLAGEQGSCDRTTVNNVEGALGWLDFNLFNIVETFNMVGQNVANSLILRFKTNTVGDRDMEEASSGGAPSRGSSFAIKRSGFERNRFAISKSSNVRQEVSHGLDQGIKRLAIRLQLHCTRLVGPRWALVTASTSLPTIRCATTTRSTSIPIAITGGYVPDDVYLQSPHDNLTWADGVACRWSNSVRVRRY